MWYIQGPSLHGCTCGLLTSLPNQGNVAIIEHKNNKLFTMCIPFHSTEPLSSSIFLKQLQTRTGIRCSHVHVHNPHECIHLNQALDVLSYLLLTSYTWHVLNYANIYIHVQHNTMSGSGSIYTCTMSYWLQIVIVVFGTYMYTP